MNTHAGVGTDKEERKRQSCPLQLPLRQRKSREARSDAASAFVSACCAIYLCLPLGL